MIFTESLWGTVTVEFTSAEPEKTLEEIMVSGITISQITKQSDLVFLFRIKQKDFHSVSDILKKRGDKLHILNRQGVFWHLKSIFRRPILVWVALVLLALTSYLPTRVLFIESEGNQTLSSEEILAAAEQCGISFGAPRKYIRSEKAKNELLSLLPELQWAGVNTTGCRAVISVRERSEAPILNSESFVSNLIAKQDGYILSTTVTEGTAMVQPGDSVVAGQTLISGYIDHGLSIQATRAAGEILALTNREVTTAMPDECLLVTGSDETYYKISMLLRKKRINLWKDSRISDACCGRMYEEYFVSLPGGFRLPIAICIDRYTRYTVTDHRVTEEESYAALSGFSDTYLSSQLIAGQILQTHQYRIPSEGVYRLKSNYLCTEMIGQEQRAQIGDHNGKRN